MAHHISILPPLEELTDTELRKLGTFYYGANLDAETARREANESAKSRPVVEIPAIRALKRAIHIALGHEEETLRKGRHQKISDSTANVVEDSSCTTINCEQVPSDFSEADTVPKARENDSESIARGSGTSKSPMDLGH
ncbi:hypothetical protein HDU67_004415 [Dinochytrium kinnereticum]|nr:hypothetical protein HDU67_004415 [Dinochytrium kinnereticum]